MLCGRYWNRMETEGNWWKTGEHCPELDGDKWKRVETTGSYCIIHGPGSVNPYSYPCRHVRASDLWCRRQSDVSISPPTPSHADGNVSICNKNQRALEKSYLGASENDLSRHEDKKHNFRFDHTINEPCKRLQHGQLGDQGCTKIKTTYLWLITTKLSMAISKTLKTNWKLDQPNHHTLKTFAVNSGQRALWIQAWLVIRFGTELWAQTLKTKRNHPEPNAPPWSKGG